MDEPVTTGRNQDGTFAPGVSGNPKGRPKSTRHKLGEKFLEALLKDFEENGLGEAAIATMRADKPNEYAKMIASILPKELDADLGGALIEAITHRIIDRGDTRD